MTTKPSVEEMTVAFNYMMNVMFQKGYDDGKDGRPKWFPHGPQEKVPNLYANYMDGYEDGAKKKKGA